MYAVLLIAADGTDDAVSLIYDWSLTVDSGRIENCYFGVSLGQPLGVESEIRSWDRDSRSCCVVSVLTCCRLSSCGCGLEEFVGDV